MTEYVLDLFAWGVVIVVVQYYQIVLRLVDSQLVVLEEYQDRMASVRNSCYHEVKSNQEMVFWLVGLEMIEVLERSSCRLARLSLVC